MSSENPNYTGPERREFSHIEQQLEKIISQISHLHTAFPIVDGEVDVSGHRRYHEAKIKAAESEAKFWQGIREEAIRKGIWFTMILVLGLIVVGIQVKLAAWIAGAGK